MTIALFGASNQVGLEILQQTGSGRSVTAYSRTAQRRTPRENVVWRVANLPAPPAWPTPLTQLIYSAPIARLGALLRSAPSGLQQVVVISSMSAVSKRQSVDAQDRHLAQTLCDGEEQALAYGRERSIPVTILRPTMIYGRGMDQNVAVIRRFVERYGFFILPPPPYGLRQPVHAADVAAAALRALEVGYTGVLPLGGGERIPYSTLVERVFAAAGRRSRVWRLPRPLVRLAARLAGGRTAMVDRIADDLVADNGLLNDVLGVAPRRFEP